jgi:hypothetical protein
MKEKSFYIDTPPINIGQLSDKDDFQINFDLKKDDFIGMLKIRLDPDYMEWDSHDGEEYFPRDCNRLIFLVTTELEISEAQFLENTYSLVKKYLNIFFNYLQIELGQYWVDVGPIPDWGLLTLLDKTVARRVVADGEEKLSLPLGGYRNKVDFSPKRRVFPEKSSGLDVKQIQHIKSWFEELKEPEPAKLLLTKAKRLLIQGELRSSSIYAISALEKPLKGFVDERCAKMGIEPKPKPRFVGHYLNLFPDVLETDELTKWLNTWMESRNRFAYQIDGAQIVDWAKELNQKRSGTVHNEEDPPNFETIDKGIFAVEAIIEFAKEGNL